MEVVEQDTTDEVAQCVEVLMLTVEGERIELPEYGVPDLAFSTGIPMTELETRIEEWEPRAEFLLEEDHDELDELVRRVQIKVSS